MLSVESKSSSFLITFSFGVEPLFDEFTTPAEIDITKITTIAPAIVYNKGLFCKILLQFHLRNLE